MLNKFLFIAFFVFGYSTLSQGVVVIENTADNAILFDENDPDSFLYFFKSNAHFFGYLNLEGISYSDMNLLDEEQKKTLVQYIGAPGMVPLINEDPNSPDFEEYLIVLDEDGLETYVYDAPDTVTVDLADIARITFNYNEADGSIWDSITKMTLWKKNDQAYYQVLSLEGWGTLSFVGFSVIRPLEAGLNDELINPNNPKSMWNVMRDSSVNRLNELKSSGYKRSISPPLYDFFPGEGIRYGMYNSSEGPRQFKAFANWQNFKTLNFYGEYVTEVYPFSLELGRTLYQDTTQRQSIHSLFNKVHLRYSSVVSPIIYCYPAPPKPGDTAVIKPPSKKNRYVFGIPRAVYYWLDFESPKIFVSESFQRQGFDIVSETTIDDLFFTMPVDGEDAVVLCAPMDEALESYFKNHKPIVLEDLGWNKHLNAVVNDPKNQILE